MLEKVIKIISKELIISFFCLIICFVLTLILDQFYQELIIKIIDEVFLDFSIKSHQEIIAVLKDLNVSNKEIIEKVLTKNHFSETEIFQAKKTLYTLNIYHWIFLFCISVFIVYSIRFIEKLIFIVCK